MSDLRAYKPTPRDRIATTLLGEHPSTGWNQFVQGLIGSRGIGQTGMSLSDFTPLSVPLYSYEMGKSAALGQPVNAALNAVSAIPGAGSMLLRGTGRIAKAVPEAVRAMTPAAKTVEPAAEGMSRRQFMGNAGLATVGAVVAAKEFPKLLADFGPAAKEAVVDPIVAAHEAAMNSHIEAWGAHTNAAGFFSKGPNPLSAEPYNELQSFSDEAYDKSYNARETSLTDPLHSELLNEDAMVGVDDEHLTHHKQYTDNAWDAELDAARAKLKFEDMRDSDNFDMGEMALRHKNIADAHFETAQAHQRALNHYLGLDPVTGKKVHQPR